jgi:hypothetical protein
MHLKIILTVLKTISMSRKEINKKRLHSTPQYMSPDQFELEVALIPLLNYPSTIRGSFQFLLIKGALVKCPRIEDLGDG